MLVYYSRNSDQLLSCFLSTYRLAVNIISYIINGQTYIFLRRVISIGLVYGS